MRAEYEAWEKGLGDDDIAGMMREEGYPFWRIEQIVVGGVISGRENFTEGIPVAGFFMMPHPTSDDRVYGRLVSRMAGESYAEGRVTEDSIDFVEFYPIIHSENCSRKYGLVRCKDTGFYEGRFSCDDSDKELAEGFIRLNVVQSAGMIKPSRFNGIPPQGMDMANKYQKIEEFFNSLK